MSLLANYYLSITFNNLLVITAHAQEKESDKYA